MKNTLEDLLEQISVIDPDMRDANNDNTTKWFAVSNEDGIIAYFSTESDALRFRLSYINLLLNPII